MDIFEDIGGCALIAIASATILLLIACVALVVLGGALHDLVG